jgi:DNA-binding protein HU-beta
MTKSEVLKNLAEELDLTQSETEELYDSFIDRLTMFLANGKGFTLPGLGSFKPEIREEHKSYNPHYKQMMRIPTKQVAHYTQSSTLRDQINEGEDE